MPIENTPTHAKLTPPGKYLPSDAPFEVADAVVVALGGSVAPVES